MDLHPSWRAILDCAELIPIPLDASGIPYELATAVQDVTGEDRWLVIAPAAARLTPQFPAVFRRHAGARRNVGVFYADEAEEAGIGDSRLQLKPEINLPLLVADDYIGSPLIVLLAVFNRLGGFRAEAGSAAVYDLLLRAIRAGVGIARIPVVMVAHEGRRPRPRIEDRRAAVNSWIGNSADVLELAPGLTDSSLQLRRRFRSYPEVTLVIPTRQARPNSMDGGKPGTPHIINMLDSLSMTNWPMERLKVLIGDDIPDGSIYSGSDYPFDLQRVVTQRPPGVPFNYAAKMNALWKQARTEHLVLINDDVLVTGPGWLRALMTFAMNEDVGGVGARLLFGDGTIQHAGMPGGLFGAHAWIFQPADAPTYNDWALVHREWSMVTGAVFATRRSVLDLVDGFDERFSLEFNDVDLCLRLKLLGYKIIYTPFAELVHHERSSRRDALPGGDQMALYLKRWSELLTDDPAFHPGFQQDNTRIAPMPVIDAWYAIRAPAEDG
jgi:hypothetical protein